MLERLTRNHQGHQFRGQNLQLSLNASEKVKPNIIHQALQVASLRLGLGLDTDYTTLERINGTEDPAEAQGDSFWLGGLGQHADSEEDDDVPRPSVRLVEYHSFYLGGRCNRPHSPGPLGWRFDKVMARGETLGFLTDAEKPYHLVRASSSAGAMGTVHNSGPGAHQFVCYFEDEKPELSKRDVEAVPCSPNHLQMAAQSYTTEQ